MAPVREWFRSKRVGWGWSPNSWEGWAVTGAVVVLVVLSAVLAATHG